MDHTFLKRVIVYSLAKAGPGAMVLFTTLYYINTVGPEIYGEYALAVSMVGVAEAALVYWILVSFGRYFYDSSFSNSECFRTVFQLMAAISIAAFAGGLAAFFLLEDRHLGALLLLGTALFVAQSWYDLELQIAATQMLQSRYGVLALVRATLMLCAGVTGVYLSLGSYGLIAAAILGCSVPALSRTALRRWADLRWLHIEVGLIRKLFRFGVPLAGSFLCMMLMLATDRLLLGWFNGPVEVGLYAASSDLTNLSVAFTLNVVNLAGYPAIVKAFENGGLAAAKPAMEVQAAVLLLVIGPFILVFVSFAPEVARVALGHEYATVAPSVIPWIAVSTAVAGFRAFYADLAFQLGQQTQGQLLISVGAVVLNLLLGLLLVPRFGVWGAAVATAVTQFMALCASIGLGRAWALKLPFPPRPLLTIAVAFALAQVTALFMPQPTGMSAFAIATTAVLSVYAATLILADFAGLRSLLVKMLLRTANVGSS